MPSLPLQRHNQHNHVTKSQPNSWPITRVGNIVAKLRSKATEYQGQVHLLEQQLRGEEHSVLDTQSALDTTPATRSEASSATTQVVCRANCQHAGSQ